MPKITTCSKLSRKFSDRAFRFSIPLYESKASKIGLTDATGAVAILFINCWLVISAFQSRQYHAKSCLFQGNSRNYVYPTVNIPSSMKNRKPPLLKSITRLLSVNIKILSEKQLKKNTRI